MATLLRRFALAPIAVVALLPLAAPAAASEQHAHGSTDIQVEGVDPLATTSLTASRAVGRDCTARALTGRSGVATSRYTAANDGQVTFRLRGRGDWDLAVFDTAGSLVGSSAAFGGNEVAQVGVKKGTRLLVQACRRKGAGATAVVTSQLARVDWDKVKGPEGKTRMVRVLTESRKQIAALEHLGFDVTHDINARGPAVALYGDAQLERLKKLGLPYETVIGDADAYEADQRAEQRAWSRRVGGRSALPSGRTDYRVLADYQRELKEIAEKYPAIVRPFNLNEKTFQGRDIQALEITENAQTGDDGRPVLWVNGIHHAREWPAAESVMELAHELVKGYGTNPRITKILRDVRIIVQPLTNYDGFLVSRESVEDPDPDQDHIGIAYELASGVVIFGGSLSYKRKNCNPLVPAGAAYPCELALGVDNNRNYGHDWGGPGASSNPNDQSYRGPAPFSEPETRAVQHLSSTMNITVNLSMHNVAAKVLRPPGLEADGFAPDEEGLKALGQKIADATNYANEYGWQLYDTTGSSKDWEYGALGQYAYTIELGGSGFHGNYKKHVVDQYEGSTGKSKGKGLREGYLAAAEWTRDVTRTSRVAGRSIPGRTLRITKKFETETSDVCPIVDPLAVDPGELLTGETTFYCEGPTSGVQKLPEKIDMTMTVPANGRFEWFVNPSTRPFVGKKGGREAYTLTCEQDGTVVETHEVFVARGELAQLDLPCGGTLLSDDVPAPAPAPPAGAAPILPAPKAGAPSQSKLAVKVLSVKRSGKRARIVLRVTGGTLRNATIALLDRRGKRIGSVRVKSLKAGRRTITVRAKRTLRKGTYRVRVSGTGLKALTRTAKMR